MPKRTASSGAASFQKPQPIPDLGGAPALVTALEECLRREGMSAPRLTEELRKLEDEHQDHVYAEVIHLLSHLRLEPGQAKQCWYRILDHCNTMQERLGAPVDLRVALASYFLQVDRLLENPKIIEMRAFEQTRATAFQDDLTGLRNYRFFNAYLTQEVRRTKQYGAPLSLIMVDVDHFKAYNDRNGHDAGNKALAAIARLLHESLRESDVPARYGGEEFAILLPSTPKTGARVLAERARVSIEKYVFPHEEFQPAGRLTVSMGIAACPGDATGPQELLVRADRAMYLAKAGGRNQVQLFDGSQRSYRRVAARLNGKYFRITGEPRPLTTLNISERGLSLVTEHEIPMDSLIEISLVVPGSEDEVLLHGRVVRGEKTDVGHFKAGINILEIRAQDRVVLKQYLQRTPHRGTTRPGAQL